MQTLIDRCYETGRYWQVSQRPLPASSLPLEEEWLEQQCVSAGLIEQDQTDE